MSNNCGSEMTGVLCFYNIFVGVVPERQSKGEKGQESEFWFCREGAGWAFHRGRGKRQSLVGDHGPFSSFGSFPQTPKPLVDLLTTFKHIPCPLCCQTCNLNTPKMQSHSGPKTYFLDWKYRENPKQALFTTAFIFSFTLCFLAEKSSSPSSVWFLTTTKHHLDIKKNNQMPQRPKSILQVCDLTAQLDLQSTSRSARQTQSGPSTRQC